MPPIFPHIYDPLSSTSELFSDSSPASLHGVFPSHTLQHRRNTQYPRHRSPSPQDRRRRLRAHTTGRFARGRRPRSLRRRSGSLGRHAHCRARHLGARGSDSGRGSPLNARERSRGPARQVRSGGDGAVDLALAGGKDGAEGGLGSGVAEGCDCGGGRL